MKTIRSRDNALVKQLIALAHSSRERKKAGLTVLDGIHLVRAYIDAVGEPVDIMIGQSAMDRLEVVELLGRCQQARQSVFTDPLMAAASALDSPAFVIAIVSTPVPQTIPEDADVVLALEDVQDPGNVGSMLRSAAAAGVKHVALSSTCAFAWSPKVLRAAQGAHFSLNISEGLDLADFVGRMHGQSLALVPSGGATKSLFETNLRNPTILLIGNEGAGLSQELVAAASARVTIPMPGKIESLNAAAAGAICLFELVRQRQIARR